MRTGDQWKDTYHIEGDSITPHVVEEGHTSNFLPLDMARDRYGRDELSQTMEESVGVGGLEGKSLQGMLFSPQTGTGQKDDPLVSENTRRSAIREAYSLDPGSDRNIAAANFVGRKAGKEGPSKQKRTRDANVALEAIHDTDIPMHEIQSDKSHPAVIATDKNYRGTRGRGGGSYWTTQNVAFTKTESKKERVTKDVKVAIAGEEGSWQRNPKPLDFNDTHRLTGFGDWEEGRADKSNKPQPPSDEEMAAHKERKAVYKDRKKKYEAWQSDVIEPHLGTRTSPASGNRILRTTQDVLSSQVGTDPEGNDLSSNSWGAYSSDNWTTNELTRGPQKPFSPKKRYKAEVQNWETRKEARDKFPGISEEHLFTQPAPQTNSDVYNVPIGKGYQYTNTDAVDKDTSYWGRQKATAWETKQVTTEKNVRFARNSTMVHEIGHGMHLAGGKGEDRINAHTLNRRADPLYEGVADGYMDRFSSNTSGQHTDMLRDPDMRDVRTRNSYGSKNTVWTSDTQRALYTAARAHAAENPHNLPSSYRNQTMESIGRGAATNPHAFDAGTNAENYEIGNRMALGRMMEEQPEVRAAFTDTGGRNDHMDRMSATASQAHADYLRHLDTHRRNAAGNPVEQQLPF